MKKFKNSFPMMLQQTFDSIIPEYRKVFKQHDITEQQWRILRVLWETDNCTTKVLSQDTLLPSPSLVGIIDRMKKKDLVSRTRSTEDRRKVYVKLTTKGHSLQAEIAPKIDEIYLNIENCCDAESWKIMITTMQKIIDTNEIS